VFVVEPTVVTSAVARFGDRQGDHSNLGSAYQAQPCVVVTGTVGLDHRFHDLECVGVARSCIADMAGKKIRVQESELFNALIEALDASPTPMAYGEVYTALQSGVIDGAENNEVSYYTQKHYEVAPYYSYSRHLIGIDYLIVNSGVLDRMSEEDRGVLDEAWVETYEQHTDLWTEATDDAIANAEAGGATFTEVDSEAFVSALTPLVDEFLTEDGQQSLYDTARAAAGE
jgi:TRAP-type C4-dicarboxylate transport system substrate-binding protein